MESEYGKQMFGRHDLPASVGITGSIELVSLEGPMCELALTGKFWHKRGTYSYLSIDISFLLIFWSKFKYCSPQSIRNASILETVLGKAAIYINARLPEITSVTVSSLEDLEDFPNVIDECTGEVIYVEDKRSPDFNGDRETMEYQGLDPDIRGPFVFGSGGPMIRPA